MINGKNLKSGADRIDAIKNDIVLQFLCSFIRPENTLIDAWISEPRPIRKGMPSKIMHLKVLVSGTPKVFEYNYNKTKRMALNALGEL